MAHETHRRTGENRYSPEPMRVLARRPESAVVCPRGTTSCVLGLTTKCKKFLEKMTGILEVKGTVVGWTDSSQEGARDAEWTSQVDEKRQRSGGRPSTRFGDGQGAAQLQQTTKSVGGRLRARPKLDQMMLINTEAWTRGPTTCLSTCQTCPSRNMGKVWFAHRLGR